MELLSHYNENIKPLVPNNNNMNFQHILNSEIDNPSSNSSKYFETMLVSTKFGYNPKSKDFFIKVERNNTIYQYPTDEMMKFKIYQQTLMNQKK